MRHVTPLIALTLFAGCGGGEGNAPTAAAPSATTTAAPSETSAPAPSGEPVTGTSAPYVGSLTVDPDSGTLIIATGLGLFRLDDGAKKAKPFDGELETPEGSGPISPNLVVRYTGPGTLIASGHPKDGGSALPEDLGLIRSQDGGSTWSSVSLLGQEDLHALDARGDVVAGQPVEAELVLVSTDGGKTFQERTPPAMPIDLDLDPSKPERIALTTADGVFISNDGGGTWRQRDVATTETHLAWSEQGTLYRIDAAGMVQSSEDAGESWEPAGNAGGPPSTITVDSGGDLYVALAGGRIVRSKDGGKTFDEITSLAR